MPRFDRMSPERLATLVRTSKGLAAVHARQELERRASLGDRFSHATLEQLERENPKG